MKALLAAAILTLSVAAHAAPELGKPAPDFTAVNQDGKEVKLSDAKGKIVVLEWFNKGCPFVKKHYGSNNMQSLQKKYGKKGVVWYSIISSKEGKEGYLTPEQAKAELKGMGSKAILLDPKGDVGRLYQAKTTPHMFVIGKKGELLYMGGIDDNASADPEDIKTAKNYVAAALDETLAGKPVSASSSRPYGCSVKY
ncbi:MAG: thioredoxin family protein [Elusimicrobiota bacterium]|nr:MAG: thioredoxin family protein [Elusimicrobiota bacterium]